MSKKERKQQEEDLDKFFEQSLPKAGFSPALLPVYVIPALLASASSAYLFYSIQQLNTPEYYPLFAAVATITTLLLVLAYHNTKTNLHSRLLSSRPEAQMPLGERNADKQKKAEEVAQTVRAATATEAGSFSVLYNTLLYSSIYVLFGFFLLGRWIPGLYNYPATSLLSAGLVLAASRAK